MGKAQTKRRTRHNPIRVPDAHISGSGAGAAQKNKEEQVLPVLNKMNSADSTDRVWACAAVSNLITNDPATRRLLQGRGVVALLIERLTDSVPDVVGEAVGALRNLCIDGGPEICAEMFNKNILAPLTTHIPKITALAERVVSGAKAENDEEATVRKMLWSWTENVITIFWCLSETSNKALQAVNALNLPPFLVSFLQTREKIPILAVIAAAHSLYVLTEDNPPAVSAIHNDASSLKALIDIAKTESPEGNDRALMLRVLACGVLRNLAPLPPLLADSTIDHDRTVLLPILTKLINLNLEEQASRALTLASTLPEPETKKPGAPKSDHKTDEERELEALERRLMTLQLSLEVLTSFCAQIPEDDAEWEDEAEDEEDDDEEMTGDDVDALLESTGAVEPAENGDEEMDSDAPAAAPAAPLPSTLIYLIRDAALPQHLLTLSRPTSLSFPPLVPLSSPLKPSPHPPTTAMLSAAHLRALECLQNLFLSFARHLPAPGASEEQAAPLREFVTEIAQPLREIWNALFIVAGELSAGTAGANMKGQELRTECVEAAVGCMFGVARLGTEVLEVDPSQIPGLIESCKQTPSDSLKAKAIGTLGALARRPNAVGDNQTIGAFLMTVLSALPTSTSAAPAGSTSAEVMIAALNEVYDVYADENAPWDSVFRQGGFLPQLKALVPKVRAVTRGVDRKRNPDLRAQADEAYQNLLGFIRYRQSV